MTTAPIMSWIKRSMSRGAALPKASGPSAEQAGVWDEAGSETDGCRCPFNLVDLVALQLSLQSKP
jgi:hypothetical protein